jgi:hypothetical protein
MFEIIAPPNLKATMLLRTGRGARLSWSPYSAGDRAGHQVLGYRLYRSFLSGQRGPLIADEATLGPASNYFDDVSGNQNTTTYYTLVAVEPTDFGSRPFGEGGAVPFGV